MIQLVETEQRSQRNLAKVKPLAAIPSALRGSLPLPERTQRPGHSSEA